MADYWVDDGGPALPTADGTSWATAYRSIADLISEVAAALTTSGNRIFIADDHNEPNVGAAKVYTGPSSGLPVVLISCDRADTSSTPAYKVGTGNQLSSLGGAYRLTLTGVFALYGIKCASGENFSCNHDGNDEWLSMENCTVALGANGTFWQNLQADARETFINLTIDLSSDGVTTRTEAPLSVGQRGISHIQGLSFVNAGYRTGSIVDASSLHTDWTISNADFSGFTQAACEILAVGGGGFVTFNNCKTVASPTYTVGARGTQGSHLFVNCADADSPAQLYHQDFYGSTQSTTSVSRTGGGTVETIACSWLVVTTSACSEYHYYRTPFIYGTVSSAGSKNFDVYITNDTGDFDNSQVWLEVEYMATSNVGVWTMVSDHRALPVAATTSPNSVSRDDTTSAWSGGAAGFDTYKQRLRVTATIGEADGQYRARVCVGVTTLPSTRDFYIDPKVTVS